MSGANASPPRSASGVARSLKKLRSDQGMTASSRHVQNVYLLLLLLHTLAASFIWGINTLFLLDAGLSNVEAFAANAFFTAGVEDRMSQDSVRDLSHLPNVRRQADDEGQNSVAWSSEEYYSLLPQAQLGQLHVE